MNFHEVRFPTSLSLGSVGGPQRWTEIVSKNSGFEERNSPWEHSRRRYDAGVAMRSTDDLQDVVAFFEARRGPLFGFRWKDWTDFKSCLPSQQPGSTDQEIAVGDEETLTFQLCKNYRSGNEVYCRHITKPVQGTLRVAMAGVDLSEGVHYSCDYTTGQLTFFDPPPLTAVLSAGYEFDVPVRFDTDWLEVSQAIVAAGEVARIPVVEVRV